MTTLLFARHGQASFGQQNYDQLSELGAKQAQLLGQYYASSGRLIDGIITGSLSRQRDSAKHFLQSYQSLLPTSPLDLADPLIIEGLNEFNHEDVLMKSNPKFATQIGILTEIAKAPVPKVRLAELFYEAMQRWHSGDYDDEYEESWSQFNDRVQQALSQIITQFQCQTIDSTSNPPTFLIFTSGGVIAAICAYLLGQGSQSAKEITSILVNTGVTTVLVKDAQPKLLSLNEYSHLYQDGQNYLTWH